MEEKLLRALHPQQQRTKNTVKMPLIIARQQENHHGKLGHFLILRLAELSGRYGYCKISFNHNYIFFIIVFKVHDRVFMITKFLRENSGMSIWHESVEASLLWPSKYVLVPITNFFILFCFRYCSKETCRRTT